MSDKSTASVAERPIVKLDVIPSAEEILKNSHIVGGFEDILDGLGADYELRVITDYEIESYISGSGACRGDYSLVSTGTPVVETAVDPTKTNAEVVDKADDEDDRESADNVAEQVVRRKRLLGRAARQSSESRPGSGFTRMQKVAGAVALGAFAAGFGGPAYDSFKEVKARLMSHDVAFVDHASDIVEYDNVDFNTVWMPIGGAGQGAAPPVDQMQRSGLMNGMQVDPVFYSAEIGPFVGMKSMRESEREGVNYALPRVIAALDDGERVEIPAFSEGTGVQRHLAWALHDHYGYTPENVHFTQIGGPYHPGGIFDSPFTKTVGPVLNMVGIDTGDGDNNYPADANVEYVYFADDGWAGNGNENFLTYMKNFLAFGVGAHDIPNENDPASQGAHLEVFKDRQGRLHKVYVRDEDVFIQALRRAGIEVMDSAMATAAINAFFPQNIDPNSTEPPRADVRAGLKYAAIALDHQIDPSGNLKFFEGLIDAMPDEFKGLLDDGWNGINDVMSAVAKAINEPTPENIANVFGVVVETINKIGSHLSSGAAPINMQSVTSSLTANGNVTHAGVASLAEQIQRATGIDMGKPLQSLFGQVLNPNAGMQSMANAVLHPVPAAQPVVLGKPLAAPVPQGINGVTGETTSNAPSGARPAGRNNNPIDTGRITPNPVNSVPTGITGSGRQAPSFNIPTPQAPVISAPAAPVEKPAPAPAPVSAPAPRPIPAPVISAPPRIEVPAAPKPAPAPAPAPAPRPAPAPVVITPPRITAPRIQMPAAPRPTPAPAPAPAISLPRITLPAAPRRAPISAPTSRPSRSLFGSH